MTTSMSLGNLNIEEWDAPLTSLNDILDREYLSSSSPSSLLTLTEKSPTPSVPTHAEPIPLHHVAVMVVGPTGTGKSAFLNWLSGESQLFVSKRRSDEGVTPCAKEVTRCLGGCHIHLIDTIGFGDPARSSTVRREDTYRALQRVGIRTKGVRAFVYMLSMAERCSAQVRTAWRQFVAEFGSDAVTRTMIVVSHLDLLEDDNNDNDDQDAARERWKRDLVTEFPELPRFMTNRMVFVKASPPYTVPSLRQRRDVLRMIRSFPGDYKSSTFRAIMDKEAKTQREAEEAKQEQEAKQRIIEAENARMVEEASWTDRYLSYGDNTIMPGKYRIYVPCFNGGLKMDLDRMRIINVQGWGYRWMN